MTEHKLSEQELQQIREEAEYNYHIVSEDMFDDTFMDYDDYVKERQKLQRTYIAALTRERERVKGLEEAVKKLAQATSNLIQDVKNKPNDTRYATHTKAALVALDEYLTVFDNYKNNK